jgi:energy-coupling factor transport system permease protein
VPLWGALDVTLEAVVYGAVAALRVLVVVLAFALCSATVDPDDMLRGLRRVAPRSALTASLATRMVPLLARDAERLGEAYGLRASAVAGGRLRRSAVLARALAAGGLERAMDTAAALELRGYALGARRSGRAPRPWSVDDLAFALSAAAVVAVTVAARIAGIAAFDPYPLLRADGGAPEVALALALPAITLAPFALAARRRAALRVGGAHA